LLANTALKFKNKISTILTKRICTLFIVDIFITMTSQNFTKLDRANTVPSLKND